MRPIMGYDVSNLFHNVFNMISFVADLKVPDSFEDGLARLHQLWRHSWYCKCYSMNDVTHRDACYKTSLRAEVLF